MLDDEFFKVPWLDPKELTAELPAVPAFDIGNLPAVLRPLVAEVSESMQIPYDYPSAAVITSLAGCVNHRAVVYPKALDSSWKEICNLWGGIIGNPGLMKTPVVKLINRPLEAIQREWNEAHEADEEIHERLKQELKMAMEVYESAYKTAMRTGKTLPPRPDDRLYAPRERRLIVTDCTFEMLHQIMSGNASGVFQLRDELSGFFSGLEREGRQGEREFWLQAWGGDSGFTVDRIGRGSIYVPHVCASLFGCWVPAKVRFYMTSVLAGGVTDDGMVQRFQVVTWPDVPKDWKYIDRISSNTAAVSAERIYRTLVQLSGEYPLELRFDCEAQGLFISWLTDLELRLRSDTLNPVMAGHVSKFRKLVPVLAGIFELAEAAERGDLVTCIVPEEPYLNYARRIVLEDAPQVQSTGATPIRAQNILRAIRLGEYFEAHARRVYSCLISPEVRAGHALARHIKKGDLDAQFSTRDIGRRCWSDLNTVELTTAGLTYLAELTWIRQVEMPVGPKGGRPSEVWNVNPKVFKKD